MNDDRSDRLFFDTDSLPERERFPAFCEGMFRNIIGADIVQHGSMPFSGMIETWCAGAVQIADIATTTADIVRRVSHVSDGNDRIVVQLWQHGLAAASQGQYQSRIKTYDGLVLDNARVGKLGVEAASRFWMLAIPRDRISNSSPNMANLAGAKLNDDVSVRLLFAYLDATRPHHLGNHQAAKLLGDHLVDLVALALGGDARELTEQGGVRAARLAAILDAISNQAADHGLSAAAVAAQLGITPRYVHLLLEQSGRNFTQHLLQKRLEKAEKLLSDDQGQNRRIADIALEAGFADLSHFNRSFRRHFGDTPSGARAKRAKSFI